MPTHSPTTESFFPSVSMRSDGAHTPTETSAKKMAPIQRLDSTTRFQYYTPRKETIALHSSKCKNGAPKIGYSNIQTCQNETAQNRSNSSLESNIPFHFLPSRAHFFRGLAVVPQPPRPYLSRDEIKKNPITVRVAPKSCKKFHFWPHRVRCGVCGQNVEISPNSIL